MNHDEREHGRSREVVYCVIAPTPSNGLKKAYWQRVGMAFENRDGSRAVLLNALPLNGRLILRREQGLERIGREADPKDFQAA